MMASLGDPPAILKPISAILKIANDHDKIDPIVAYWCRLYAIEVGLKVDSKTPECRQFLGKLMQLLEKEKQTRKNEEAISNDIVAQSHVENHAMKLFEKADKEDRSGNATRNTSKLYFTASQIFDALAIFNDVSEEVQQKSKYAKWRAAYIIKCFKNNEKPLPPLDDQFDDCEANNGESRPQPPSLPTQQPSSSSISEVTSHITPHTPTPARAHEESSLPQAFALSGVPISSSAIIQAQKFCKWAGSALQYEDIKTAVENIEKALTILKTGGEVE